MVSTSNAMCAVAPFEYPTAIIPLFKPDDTFVAVPPKKFVIPSSLTLNLRVGPPPLVVFPFVRNSKCPLDSASVALCNIEAPISAPKVLLKPIPVLPV